VGVEKLLPAKFAKIKSRQEAPQSIFLGRVDIFYPPNFACLGRKGSFSTATPDNVNNREFVESRRMLSAENKFDEEQLVQREADSLRHFQDWALGGANIVNAAFRL
jgi:hypothetical protein